jgi:hypothetical protein
MTYFISYCIPSVLLCILTQFLYRWIRDSIRHRIRMIAKEAAYEFWRDDIRRLEYKVKELESNK